MRCYLSGADSYVKGDGIIPAVPDMGYILFIINNRIHADWAVPQFPRSFRSPYNLNSIHDNVISVSS